MVGEQEVKYEEFQRDVGRTLTNMTNKANRGRQQAV